MATQFYAPLCYTGWNLWRRRLQRDRHLYLAMLFFAYYALDHYTGWLNLPQWALRNPNGSVWLNISMLFCFGCMLALSLAIRFRNVSEHFGWVVLTHDAVWVLRPQTIMFSFPLGELHSIRLWLRQPSRQAVTDNMLGGKRVVAYVPSINYLECRFGKLGSKVELSFRLRDTQHCRSLKPLLQLWKETQQPYQIVECNLQLS